MKKAVIPVHETFHIAALLAVVGGFLDAYTYILRGGVFANAQTGNMVLLAVFFAQGEINKALYYVVPIAAFAAGVFMTELLKSVFTSREFRIYEHFVIGIELVILAIVGFLPTSVPNGIVNVTVSFVCSLQANSFRKVQDLPYASTMCTGNLRSGTEKLFRFVIQRDQKAGKQSAHYFGIIFLFIVGALLGTVCAGAFGAKSVWLCCVILLVIICLMIKERV